MIIKQGMFATQAGKGELNSALTGLGSLCGIVGPGLMWAPLFRYFERGGQPAVLRWGAGGHFFVVAALMLVGWTMVQVTPKDKLYKT